MEQVDVENATDKLTGMNAYQYAIHLGLTDAIAILDEYKNAD